MSCVWTQRSKSVGVYIKWTICNQLPHTKSMYCPTKPMCELSSSFSRKFTVSERLCWWHYMECNYFRLFSACLYMALLLLILQICTNTCGTNMMAAIYEPPAFRMPQVHYKNCADYLGRGSRAARVFLELSMLLFFFFPLPSLLPSCNWKLAKLFTFLAYAKLLMVVLIEQKFSNDLSWQELFKLSPCFSSTVQLSKLISSYIFWTKWQLDATVLWNVWL